MANLAAYAEKAILNTFLRRLTTTVSGSNASTSNILVTSSTGFNVGDVVKLTTAGSYHKVTAVPDGTHVTVSPALGSAPTTGSVTRYAYAPDAIYVGLFTAAPSDSGGGTEVSGGSYARVQVTQDDASWAAPSGTPSSTSNSAAVTFPAPTANWGTISHFGIFDASSGGNLIAWAALAASKTINNGDSSPSYAAGALVWAQD